MKTEDDYGFFHLCTNGMVLPWMFKDDEDFIYGINRIGVCCLLADISVLAFSLMDNHVHFLLYGTLQQCRRFINRYKQLTGKWISHKYEITKFLKRLPVSIIRLKTEEDVIETAAYIDRNAIMGGFRGMPHEYRWGSCRLMFKSADTKSVKWNVIKDFSENELRGILKTRVSLPKDWIFDNDGMLNPLCFTDIKKIETLFRSPNKYLYYLVKKIEGKINQTIDQHNRPFVSDKDLRDISGRFSEQMFGTKDIRTLDVRSRLTLARKLKSDFASSAKQLSRILHLEASILKDFI